MQITQSTLKTYDMQNFNIQQKNGKKTVYLDGLPKSFKNIKECLYNYHIYTSMKY